MPMNLNNCISVDQHGCQQRKFFLLASLSYLCLHTFPVRVIQGIYTLWLIDCSFSFFILVFLIAFSFLCRLLQFFEVC